MALKLTQSLLLSLLLAGFPPSAQAAEVTLPLAGEWRFRLDAGDVGVDLVVLPLTARPNPPLNPVTERAERGADIDRVRDLVDAGSEPGSYLREMGR